MKKAVVIGAGIGGIAAGLRLKHKGYEVQVLEANNYAGGKMHVYKQGGYRWDAGPSLFTMPHLVDDLFNLYNEKPQKHFTYSKKEIVCNYFWEDGNRFSVPSNTRKFVKNAASTFGITEKKLNKYLKSNKKKYDLTASIFLEKSLHKWKTWVSKDVLVSLLQTYKLNVSSSLNNTNERYFSESPHMVQLFNRYATYNGSSPYETPGIMSMIPHLEMHYGTFYPKGGMHQIAMSLVNFSKQKGVQYYYNTSVEKILHSKKKITGVKTNSGVIDADIVVSNMDVFGTYENLLTDVPSPKRVLEQERSSSALIFYWGINREFQELDLHNIFFSDTYEKEFKSIFKEKTLHNDPTVYINITSKEDSSDSPKGCENWFVMINAPGNTGQDWNKLKEKARVRIIKKLSRILKVNIESHITEELVLDPVGIENQTRSHQGALYGAASNSQFAAFLRHPNFSSHINGLYFCGGSVHPGGGIPLCLLSAKIATDLIDKN